MTSKERKPLDDYFCMLPSSALKSRILSSQDFSAVFLKCAFAYKNKQSAIPLKWFRENSDIPDSTLSFIFRGLIRFKVVSRKIVKREAYYLLLSELDNKELINLATEVIK